MRSAALAFGLALITLAAIPANAAAQSDVHIGSIAVPQTHAVPPLDGTIESAAWKNASVAHLAYDLRYHAPASQDTTVYMLTDGAFLYVAIDARQNIPVRATEHTNGVGLDTDDEFQVDLWPNGTSGFRYKFTSTPIGTHYQYSTENNSFEPEWTSVGKIGRDGYIINMKIPLAVMHGTGSGDWRVQFIRYMPVTGDIFVWSYGPSQSDFNDVNYSGSLQGLPRLSAFRPKARAGVYGLGEIASRTIGGDTSRAGADISIPLVSGAAFVATLHPDYSNVEIDQQTIAPTAFARIFNEVRPFFTQGANFYSYPNGICSGCPGVIEFYTPNIPTPRDGYAVEGQRGLFSFGALHTVIDSRSDTGEALNYVSPSQKNAINFQGSEVNFPGLHDVADGMTFTHNNLTNLNVFARYAKDSGTNVLDGGQSERYEAGAGLFSSSGANLNAVVRKVGAYFNPVDGLVQHPDISGYDINFFKPLKYPATERFIEFDVNGDLARYHNHAGALDQTNNFVNATLTTRTLFNVQASTGSSYVLVGNVFTPVSQTGGQFGYNMNGLLPTFVAFNTGRFGPGRLNSWTRSSTFRYGTRGAITLEFDDTDQFTDWSARDTLWLERLSYAYQSGPNQSLALGVRRIIGTPAQLVTPASGCVSRQLPPEQCGFIDGWNLSAAFHQKIPGGELYVVYGDAAAFSTAPRFIVKYIKYFGADKGT